jgi:competence protein ComEA
MNAKKIIDLVIGLFLGLLIAGLLFLTARAPTGTPVVLLPSPTPQPIVVYVTGAVIRPGVYRLPPESRLVDAVQAAGGFAEGVDLNQVNLAAPITDGQQIVIPGLSTLPTPELTIGEGGLLVTPTPFAGTPININTASVELLVTLPGIGPTTAQLIVDYREDNGPFTRVEDLLKIPGIGPQTLEEIRGLITVGPNTE